MYYGSMALPKGNLLASGANTNTNGGAGTIYLKANANTKADVIIDNKGISTTRATLIPGGAYRLFDVLGGAIIQALGPITNENEILVKDTTLNITGDYDVPRNLTLQNGTLTVSGNVTVPGNLLMTAGNLSLGRKLNVTGTIMAQTGSILTHSAATGFTQSGLEIQVGGVTIDASSRIDVKGKGYLGGLQEDNISESGRTTGNIADGGSSANNGGSFGGLGGKSGGTTAASYGSILDPADLGSGGGGDPVTPASGGSGGGLVKLTSPSLILNGVINADGMDSASGAGSGGSIRLDVTNISGTGSISARGGNGSNGSGGGGGRIAVYYNINSIPVSKVTASGGKGNDGSVVTLNGGAGTVYLKGSRNTYGDLNIDNQGLDTAADSTPMKVVGKGTISIITSSSLTQSGVNWGASLLKGWWFNPNISQASFFSIMDNTADTIFMNSADGNLNSIAAVGDSFSGVCALNTLSVLGKAHLYTEEQFNVVGDALIDDATVVAGELYSGQTLLTNGGLFNRIAPAP